MNRRILTNGTRISRQKKYILRKKNPWKTKILHQKIPVVTEKDMNFRNRISRKMKIRGQPLRRKQIQLTHRQKDLRKRRHQQKHQCQQNHRFPHRHRQQFYLRRRFQNQFVNQFKSQQQAHQGKRKTRIRHYPTTRQNQQKRRIRKRKKNKHRRSMQK